jgi:hypothetical protein
MRLKIIKLMNNKFKNKIEINYKFKGKANF